ncbi:MAG: hypothetical protein MI919_42280 [Holophagales bacterium]|nr:hypothetical protein [Holophagales bacterium]
MHLRRKPLAEAIELEALAEKTEGYSGADLAELCRRAALTAVGRAIEEGHDEPRIFAADLEAARSRLDSRRALDPSTEGTERASGGRR